MTYHTNYQQSVDYTALRQKFC